MTFQHALGQRSVAFPFWTQVLDPMGDVSPDAGLSIPTRGLAEEQEQPSQFHPPRLTRRGKAKSPGGG